MINDQSMNNMIDIQTLPEHSLSWWTRKCLRSKRMTRWFLPTEKRQISALSLQQSIDTRCSTEWVPETDAANNAPHTRVGDVRIIERCTPIYKGHPAIVHCVIQDACVKSCSDLVYAENRVLHHDLINLPSDLLPEESNAKMRLDISRNIATYPRTQTTIHDLDCGFSILSQISSNYAHWLTEILPKAVLWGLRGEGTQVPILVDAGLHPNIMRSLELAVPDHQPILLIPKHQVVKVGRLHHLSSPGYVPYEPRCGSGPARSHGTFSAEALKLMAHTIKAKLGLHDHEPQNEVLYIHRNSGYRNALNQVELDTFVAQQGWKVIYPETLSFDEQVRTFHRASMVVGLTGAAMANLVFTRPGCRVGIMISTTPGTIYYYWHNMAEAMGVCVEYILCEPEPGTPRGVHSDFLVPIEEMKRAYTTDRAA